MDILQRATGEVYLPYLWKESSRQGDRIIFVEPTVWHDSSDSIGSAPHRFARLPGQPWFSVLNPMFSGFSTGK